jgi:TPR repeat protein
MARAKELLRRASDSGSALATYNLGAIAYNEKSTEAYNLFLRATEQGKPEAYTYAAFLRDKGEGVEIDVEAAADLILSGVVADDGEAIKTLMSRQWGWSADMIRAVQLRLQAAGYYDGAIDGRRGPKMEAALAAWRRLGAPKS